MSSGYAFLVSIGACAAAAAFEGVCAGKNVKSFYAELRFPRYSAPLWVWGIIGGLYYLTFCFVLYRLLRLGESALRGVALALILFMMAVNALTNYVIFRARDLRLSFIIGSLFPVMDVALFICLTRLDGLAAWSLVPYLLYRVYALWWGYGLWKMKAMWLECSPCPPPNNGMQRTRTIALPLCTVELTFAADA
jgi:tryptophan-rich sensory protein